MTNQKAKQIYGDVNAWLYGGAYLKDNQIWYTPGLDDSKDEADPKSKVKVYQFDRYDSLEELKLGESWVDFEAVARFVDLDASSSVEDWMIAIGQYWGFENFDSHPIEMTEIDFDTVLGID